MTETPQWMSYLKMEAESPVEDRFWETLLSKAFVEHDLEYLSMTSEGQQATFFVDSDDSFDNVTVVLSQLVDGIVRDARLAGVHVVLSEQETKPAD